MKKRASNYIGIFFLLYTMHFMVSCKSVIEDDIEGKKVSINSPTASELEDYTQTFWWNPMDGVTQYEVQLVKGSFDNVQNLVFDSLVTGTKLTYTLVPADYEWRIRAVNGAYKSDYNGSKFKIKASALSLQYVLLTSPTNGGYSAMSPVVLTWGSLYGATSYQVQVDITNAFTTGILIDATTPALSYPLSSLTEQTYYWRVRAANATETSMWSTVYSFTYDVTKPATVSLLLPADNATGVSATGNLTWTSLGTGIKYIVYTQYGAAAETQTSPISTNSYGYTGTTGEIVKWRVQSVDAAGNKGDISVQRQFTIQ